MTLLTSNRDSSSGMLRQASLLDKSAITALWLIRISGSRAEVVSAVLRVVLTTQNMFFHRTTTPMRSHSASLNSVSNFPSRSQGLSSMIPSSLTIIFSITRLNLRCNSLQLHRCSRLLHQWARGALQSCLRFQDLQRRCTQHIRVRTHPLDTALLVI